MSSTQLLSSTDAKKRGSLRALRPTSRCSARVRVSTPSTTHIPRMRPCATVSQPGRGLRVCNSNTRARKSDHAAKTRLTAFSRTNPVGAGASLDTVWTRWEGLEVWCGFTLELKLVRYPLERPFRRRAWLDAARRCKSGDTPVWLRAVLR